MWLDLADPHRGSQTSQYAFGGGATNITATIRPLEGDFGFAILIRDGRPGGGGGNHALSLFDFASNKPEDRQPEIALTDGVNVTIHVVADSFCEASYDAAHNLTRKRGQKVMFIDLGAGYRLEYVAPGTTVGVYSDGSRTITNGGYIYDDRDRLLLVARMAYDWYSRPRMAVNAIYNFLDVVALNYRVGDFLKDAVDNFAEDDIAPGEPASPASPQPTLNSVITQMQYDFKQGTATIRSDYGELDVKSFI